MEHKNSQAVKSISVDAADDPETQARYLLESMAVAKGVGIVEKASRPLRSLQKDVKRILKDTAKYRASRAGEQEDFDEEESTAQAKRRIHAYKQEHSKKNMQETVAAVDSPASGLQESVAEAIV